MKIYVEQYDYFWSFTPENFLKMCKEGMKGRGVLYDHYGRRLRNQPRGIYKSTDGYSAGSYYTTRNDMPLYHFLDAEVSDFIQAYEEVSQALRKERASLGKPSRVGKARKLMKPQNKRRR